MKIKNINYVKVKDQATGRDVQVTIVSQDPHLAMPLRTKEYIKKCLPQLIQLWLAIENATGYQWKCTSYMRKSPSHQHGIALDIAPDIAPASQRDYAVYSQSDPVLYKRTKLMRTLQDVAHDIKWPNDTQAIIAVEPDHLHLHILCEVDHSLDTPVRVVKWKVPKDIYPDTNERMTLGMI